MKKGYKVGIELYNSFVKSTHVNYIAGDSETMPLRIVLLKNGDPVALCNGDVVSLNFENPRRVRFTRSASIVDYERGEVLYEVQPGDIEVVGDTAVGVTVTRDGKRLSWHGFKFTVSRNIAYGQTEPPDGMINSPDFFAMSVDDEGKLVLITNDNGSMPVTIDDDGHLIYTF